MRISVKNTTDRLIYTESRASKSGGKNKDVNIIAFTFRPCNLRTDIQDHTLAVRVLHDLLHYVLQLFKVDVHDVHGLFDLVQSNHMILFNLRHWSAPVSRDTNCHSGWRGCRRCAVQSYFNSVAAWLRCSAAVLLRSVAAREISRKHSSLCLVMEAIAHFTRRLAAPYVSDYYSVVCNRLT